MDNVAVRIKYSVGVWLVQLPEGGIGAFGLMSSMCRVYTPTECLSHFDSVLMHLVAMP